MSTDVSQHVSPKQVARALGVSESSLKRWCDKGVLPMVVTPGGHRKIPLHAVVTFLRENRQTLIDPSILGLPAAARRTEGSFDLSVSRLREALLTGREEVSRQVILDLYLNNHSVEAICDHLITPVFRDIGHFWEMGAASEYQERRACQHALRALDNLRDLLPPPPVDAPVAIGGTVEGDVYDLPTAMVEITLRAHGWQASSLGSNLPFSSFLAAISDLHPRLFWLSVSHVADESAFVASYQAFYAAIPSQTKVVLGGRVLRSELLVALPCFEFCNSLGRLVSTLPQV